MGLKNLYFVMDKKKGGFEDFNLGKYMETFVF